MVVAQYKLAYPAYPESGAVASKVGTGKAFGSDALFHQIAERAEKVPPSIEKGSEKSEWSYRRERSWRGR